MYEKLTKCQNFTWYLPENAQILHDKCPKDIFGGGEGTCPHYFAVFWDFYACGIQGTCTLALPMQHANITQWSVLYSYSFTHGIYLFVDCASPIPPTDQAVHCVQRTTTNFRVAAGKHLNLEFVRTTNCSFLNTVWNCTFSRIYVSHLFNSESTFTIFYILLYFCCRCRPMSEL